MLLARSIRSERYARNSGTLGMEFAGLGRRIGLRALLARDPVALDMLLTPVNIVRYWEFPFTRRHLPEPPGRCLDVSSPRLFSLFAATHLGPTSIRIINPDARDASETERLAAVSKLTSIRVDQVPVGAIEGARDQYDSIWSISVVEHIAGDGDVEAMRLMFEALAPGGRLIVTVPVDRRAWSEYRDEDVYGLGLPREPEGYFFQRWYDELAVKTRLMDPLPSTPSCVEWFGERVAGRFAEYERDWIRRGHQRTVDDPREITDWFASYGRWADMPGQGVCGLVIEKQH